VERFEAKYAGKYAEFGKICDVYMRHICSIFFAYFQHMQLRVTENHNVIINRPILHSFDVFDLIYLTSNC